MGYNRVLPRDLFNEAKLLKCLGQLCLLIHEGKCSLKVFHDTKYWEGFTVLQDPGDGDIFVANLVIYTKSGKLISVDTGLNAKEPYPMTFSFGAVAEQPLFTDDGQLSPEYFEHLHAA